MAELTYKTKKASAISHFKLRYERQIAQWDSEGYYDLGMNNGGLWFNQQSVSLTFVFSKNKRKETRAFDLSD